MATTKKPHRNVSKASVPPVGRHLKLGGPLTADQLAALGSIAMESAYLEDLVDMLIGEITKLSDEQLRAILPGAMLAAKLDILKDLATLKLKSKSKIEEISSIIAQLKHLNSQRNIAIHGQWQSLQKFTFSDIAYGLEIEIGNAESTHVRRNKQPAKLHASRLQTLADDISEYRDQLFHFCLEPWIRPAAIRSARKSRSKSQ